MRENIRIVTNPFPLQDDAMEHRLIEHHRETLLHGMLLAGGILIMVAILW